MKWTVKRAAEVQTAFLLLTRLPAGKLNTYVPKLTDAAWAFPAVGFVVGSIIAGIYITTSHFMLPSFASAIFALIFGIFCTGAIHEDGLADCADGFGGGQNKEKKITIMADSAIGSFGMLALILVMGLRILMLSSLPSTTEIATGIIICAVISRFSMVGYLCFLPAAKQEGLGNQASADNIFPLFFAAIVALPAFYFGIFSFVYVIISMLVIALFWGIIAKYQIGGQTGDVCGAGQLLSETMGWVMLASIYAVQ